MRRPLTRRRMIIARVIAAGADLLQLGLFPIFASGGVAPPDAILDGGIAVVLTVLLGWHWSFVPSFIAELVPGLDLVPTWSAAVWIATRRGPAIPEAPPPGPPASS